MKKLLFVALLLLAVFGWQAQSEAAIGTIDARPAATLLLPYFEVDLNDPNGQTTLFSINNAGATAVLAHVVLWTDLGVSAFAFNVYLTGYDVQSINLRDIFNGTVPRTASAGQDPGDTISNKGDFSQDINFASCSGILPPPALTAPLIQHLQTLFTGVASPYIGGRCGGINYGDGIARGYVTVDTVNNCTLRVPGDPGYFGPGGTGDATNQNLLWGDYFHVNPGQNFAQGDALVHIEASPASEYPRLPTIPPAPPVPPGYPAPGSPETTVPGQYTFYGRYVGWTAADNREPLATHFAARFVNGGAFTGGTSLLYWRDSKVNQGLFTCPAIPGVRPNWYPLGQEEIVIFDEQENPVVPITSPFYPPPPATIYVPFAAAAGRTHVGDGDFPVPYNFGWLYLNLNQSNAAAGANPPEDSLAAQAWMTVTMDAEGRYSVGYPAAQLGSATATTHVFIAP